jgi:predicted Fe-S protein YdhL (DUF1289 family)
LQDITMPQNNRTLVWQKVDQPMTQDGPSSPCIGYCSTSLGDTVCKGCGRTAEEVDQWLLLDEEQKQIIWDRVNRMDTIRNRC